MLEPVTYDDLCETTNKKENIFTTELVQSLQSVKQVCLVALDSLLRQLVSSMPSTKPERRLSDSSLPNQVGNSLLGSIVQSTNRLSTLPSHQQEQKMKRSDSTPAIATLSVVQQVLTSHQAWLLDSSSDYNLCCSLAALLHHLYRLLELGSSTDDTQNPDKMTSLSPSSSIYSQLRESMSSFQKEKANKKMKINTSDTNKNERNSDELAILWDELDQLMNAITCLAQDHRQVIDSAPPAYYDIVKPLDTPSTAITNNSITGKTDKLEKKSMMDPPDYTQQVEKTQHDLDNLLSAIEQLSSLSPQLSNQRVDLTERQAKELAAATIGKTIERLSRGRMDDQRAPLPSILSKQKMLSDLMTQIQRSSLRSLDAQRASMNPRLTKKMDAINGMLNNNDRGRLTSQDWVSPEQQMIDDMTTMTDKLVKMMYRPKYTQQRYSLSALKEREFFLHHIFQKVDRMENRRMSNQDAEYTRRPSTITSQQRTDMEDELGCLFDHIHRSKSKMDNQRASFTTTSPVVLSTAST
ncbi:uncharacterized protein BX664DRAFT_325511 [Halteromyces radiatus]|uniref:uncharacterized protein n=1 Tax=Halteromyces radiatus TaxID=101107 RepID=UPI002220DEA8|nr:uncharacterized protein BX664DRAFT_325511 [Halteromyces radiatus]KAI8097069.1 hypothetical protein BX664DRAFT_325511 [Halteromyces radiatus]